MCVLCCSSQYLHVRTSIRAALPQPNTWCNRVKTFSLSCEANLWFACEIISKLLFLFLFREQIKENVTVVSVSADRSRPRGFSPCFMFCASSKRQLNHSRANYGASNSYHCVDLIEFFLRLHVWQKYEGCRASWISFTRVVFVCVASGFAQILDKNPLQAELQTCWKPEQNNRRGFTLSCSCVCPASLCSAHISCFHHKLWERLTTRPGPGPGGHWPGRPGVCRKKAHHHLSYLSVYYY